MQWIVGDGNGSENGQWVGVGMKWCCPRMMINCNPHIVSCVMSAVA